MSKSSRKHAPQEGWNTKLVRGLMTFIVLCLVFFLGFYLRGNNFVMDRMGIATVSPETATSKVTSDVSTDTFDSLSARVAEVQGILASESFNTYDLDSTTEVVMNGIAKKTGDPYVRYYTSKEYLAYQQDNSKNYYGIGVLFGNYQDKAYVVDVFEGSVAQANGVQIGDFVVAIDGVRRDNGWSQTDAIHAIDANEGHSVVITWRRPSSMEASDGTEFTTTLSCYKSTQQNVTTELEDEVGYIKVHQLGRSTASSVQNAVNSLSNQGAKAFVLDVRDVPGGYLTQAVDIASIFQESGVLVQIKTPTSTTTKSTEGKSTCSMPLCILVNENTAAAAEVLAGGLQDNSRATVIGTQTQGKGSVQVVRELSFGGAISYTAAYYLTPHGRDIDGNGISPNVVVTQDEESSEDSQKTYAMEAAAGMITS